MLRRSISVISLLILVTLCYAVYLFNDRYGDIASSPQLQLSRIDFKVEIDSSLSQKIEEQIKLMEGVQHTYFNQKDAIVVYSHNPAILSSQSVFDKIQANYSLPMERYVVDTTSGTRGCPITGPNTFLMRIGGRIWKLLF